MIDKTNLEDAATYRDFFIKAVNNMIKKYDNPERELGILFSGGMDSLTVLLAFLELGTKPSILYTLHLANYHSQDARAALRAARTLNVPIRIITIKQDYPNQFLEYTKDYMYNYNTSKKTKIENHVCMMYIFKKIFEKKVFPEYENNIKGLFYGGTPDVFMASSKNSAILCKKNPEIYSSRRLGFLLSDYTTSGLYLTLNDLAKRCFHNPDFRILDACLEATEFAKWILTHFTRFEQLHKPFDKWICKYAFKDYFDRYPWLFRRKLNMQTESKIREFFMQIFNTTHPIKKYNEIYRQVLAENKNKLRDWKHETLGGNLSYLKQNQKYLKELEPLVAVQK